jgi:hypothetical protein
MSTVMNVTNTSIYCCHLKKYLKHPEQNLFLLSAVGKAWDKAIPDWYGTMSVWRGSTCKGSV